jgi:hypothetical protein
MKRFFLMILLVSVFFTGLGGMLRETTAKFKSDEKALAILQKARLAIGGENSIAAVNSLIVTGRSTRTLKFDGTTEKTLQGDMELTLQFPDRMMKSFKLVNNDGPGGEKMINHQVDIVIVKDGEGNAQWRTAEPGADIKLDDGKKIIIKKDDGTSEEVQARSNTTFIVKKVDGGTGEIQVEAQPGGAGKQMVLTRKGEPTPGEFPWQTSALARTTLSLLLTTPQGTDVSYLYGGEESVDGTACNLINAQFGNAAVKLYLSVDSNLPVMISYQDAKPIVFAFKTHDGAGAEAGAVAGAAGDKEMKVFTHRTGPPETAEFQVRFSDYRNVNGVMLPFKWTQTMGGQPDEVTDVTGYEINPANIAEKFKSNGKVVIRQ